MHRERQPSSLASPFNHASNAHTAEWLAALIDEDVGRLDPVGLLLPVQELETVHLVPLKVMNAIGAALEPADDDRALRQVDVIPAQIASFRDPVALKGLPAACPFRRRPFDRLVALRYLLACRSCTILLDTSAPPDSRLIA